MAHLNEWDDRGGSGDSGGSNVGGNNCAGGNTWAELNSAWEGTEAEMMQRSSNDVSCAVRVVMLTLCCAAGLGMLYYFFVLFLLC